MKKISLFLLFAAVMIVSSCKDDTIVDPPDPPVFAIVSAPELMLGNVDSLYEFRILAINYDPQPDSVRCEVYLDINSPIEDFYLYDDGNARIIGTPDYASPTSTDIVPYDGIFTRRISGVEIADGLQGDIEFRFQSPDGDSISRSVVVANILECEFTDVPYPPLFEACYSSYTSYIRVAHDPRDSIDSLTLEIRTASTTDAIAHFLPVEGDTVWRYTLTPNTFPCLSGDSYVFRYTAYSHFGLTCSESRYGIYYENSPSVLSNSTLPDTIFRPVAVGDTDTVVFTVDLSDCDLEGVTDFEGLVYDFHRDTLDWAPLSFLRDNGLDPDEIAGDGVYSGGLTFNRHETLLNNMYYFRFFTFCPPSPQSDYLIDSMRVIQPPEIGGPVPTNSNDIGIGVVY